MVRFIFFDLGNTVVDYHSGPISDRKKDELGLELMREQLSRQGCSVSFEYLLKSFYLPWVNDLFPKRDFREKEYDLEDLLESVLGLKRIDCRELISSFHEPSRRYATEEGDIRFTLEELQRRRKGMGIISNTPIPGFCHDKTLARLELAEYFCCRLYSYDLGVRKPNKKMFGLAKERIGCSWEEILIVGDSYRADVETPLKLGMGALLYDRDDRFGGLPCKRISSFREILDYLESA
ncbi:MAG: HAD family hydrolase [Spirochaetales bacterium]|nr:HAD family hydrolase [Spirochaetales bacterium]